MGYWVFQVLSLTQPEQHTLGHFLGPPACSKFPSPGGTVFRDTILLSLLGLMLILVILLQNFNPPTQNNVSEPPGNVIVEIEWPTQLDTDIDLWVQAPKGEAVGYSNKGNEVLNLLRDDVGASRDISDINHEIIYSRGILAGEYVVNLHFYADHADHAEGRESNPVPVHVWVSVKTDTAAAAAVIVDRTLDLERVGDEETVFRFRLDEDGRLVVGSVNERFKALRGRGNS